MLKNVAVWLGDDGTGLMAREGGLAAVVAAINAHTADAGVGLVGCDFLSWLSSRDIQLMAEAGGVEAVTAAMKAQPEDLKIQTSGCKSPVNAVFVATKLNKRLVKASCIRAVVDAMGALLADEDVQNYGCAIMQTLTNIDGNGNGDGGSESRDAAILEAVAREG